MGRKSNKVKAEEAAAQAAAATAAAEQAPADDPAPEKSDAPGDDVPMPAVPEIPVETPPAAPDRGPSLADLAPSIIGGPGLLDQPLQIRREPEDLDMNAPITLEAMHREMMPVTPFMYA